MATVLKGSSMTANCYV